MTSLKKKKKKQRTNEETVCVTGGIRMLCRPDSPCQKSFLLYSRHLSEEEKKEALPESCQPFEVAGDRTFGLVKLVFPPLTGFFDCEHPLIDKLIVIT